MSIFDLASPGLSLWSIPSVFVVTLYPAFRRNALIKSKVGFNNIQPRGGMSRLEKRANLKDAVEMAERMDGAHKNGFEIFPLWASAVIAAKISGLDNSVVNTCSIAFVLSRIIYNYIYINQTSATTAIMRTATWLTGLSFPLYLLIQAGRALNAPVVPL